MQVLHTRLKTHCNALNHDLFKKNISDTLLCHCGSVQNTHHFFCKCPFYNIVRNDLIHKESTLHEVSIELLLYGNPNFPNDLNTKIVESVHKYILNTKRFSSNLFVSSFISMKSCCPTLESALRHYGVPLSHPPIFFLISRH